MFVACSRLLLCARSGSGSVAGDFFAKRSPGAFWAQGTGYRHTQQHSIGRNLVTRQQPGAQLSHTMDTSRRSPRAVLLLTVLALWICSSHSKTQPPQPEISPELRKQIEEKMKDMPPIPEGQNPNKIPFEIHDAVVDGDTALMQAIVYYGGNINEIGEGGQTPLLHAVMHGKEDVVRWLLKYGADVSIPEDNGWTAMHAAAFIGKPEVVKALLEYKISPDDRLKDGLAPIHRACWGKEPGHTEVIRLLLEAGVPFNMPTTQGYRPIDIVKDNNPATTKLLQQWARKSAAKAEL